MGLNSYIPGSSGVISAPASLGGGAVGVEEEEGAHVFTNTNSLMTREQEISVQEIIITVRARSFLYNQVRNIVGFLVNQGDRYDARVMKHYDLVGQYVGGGAGKRRKRMLAVTHRWTIFWNQKEQQQLCWNEWIEMLRRPKHQHVVFTLCMSGIE